MGTHIRSAGARLLLPAFVLAVVGCAGSDGDGGNRHGGKGGGMHDASVDAGDAGGAKRDAGAGDGGDRDAGDADTTGCGDGKLQAGAGEVCDDMNSTPGDGCSADCKLIEQDFACPEPGQACVSTVECGDSRVSGTETCDDGNLGDKDGCSAKCQIEPGFRCPTPGVRCLAAKCGDGIVAGTEACDDGVDPPVALDGCSVDCKLEPGFKCEQAGMACEMTHCGDGITEGTEQCDDHDNDLGDGCTPECKREPDCSAGACSSTCGDGIKLSTDTEQCDDGNTVNRDGCSSKCKTETGWQCMQLPGADELVLPIVIRDFKAYDGGAGHIDFENTNTADTGIVKALLGSDGKPEYAPASGGTASTAGKATFDQWYRDDATVNQTFVQTITLMKQPDGTFLFNDDDFFPIDTLGWGNEGRAHNFHFTSEVRYWFEYKPGQTLAFTGDDDVFVYVNKHLVVNLGGEHSAQDGSITLDASNQDALGLIPGDIYEIVVFQAERHTDASHYKLTLSDFVSTRSDCHTVCGDTKIAGDEECDDGKNDGSYGSCTSTCKRAPYCGDGIRQKDHEACDDGANITTYGSKAAPGCAPGCKRSAFCGDKHVDSLFGEQCDDGDNVGGYDNCSADCTLGPRCGDKAVQKKFGEECDDGNRVNGDGCSKDCQVEAPE